MANQDFIDRLGNSLSTTDARDDASTSSEDEIDTSLIISKVEAEPMETDDTEGREDPIQVGLPSAESKPRIKLTLRTSIPSTEDNVDAAAIAAAKPESTNGIKDDVVDGVTDEDDRPPEVVLTNQDTNNPSIPPTHATEREPRKPISERPLDARDDALKLKKAEATSKEENKAGETKVKKEPTVTPEAGAGSHETSKVTSVLTISSGPPKYMLKKKLPKLPLSTKRKLPLKGGDRAATVTEKAASSASVVKATVLDSIEVVEDVIAIVVGSGLAPGNVTIASLTNTQPGEKKRHQPKPIRLPPMTSPGLLISHLAAATHRSTVEESSCFAKPESIFQQSMAIAGYTTEGRTNHPHRGSSVERVVGDMFDSDVGFALNFPALVSKDLWKATLHDKYAFDGSHSETETIASTLQTLIPLVLVNSLKKCVKNDGIQDQDEARAIGKNGSSRKRNRPWDFREMVPVSLTMPYPKSFIEKQLKYVKQVEQREQAIVAHQEALERVEIDQEEQEFLYGKEEGAETPKIENQVMIPPIPTAPSAPPLSEFKGLDPDQYEGKHPIYIPKGKQNFVSHLDKNCFHLTDGRYFGLYTNIVADPHFVGANAPGIMGLPVSCGSGLATSSTTGATSKLDSVLAPPPNAVTAIAISKTEGIPLEKSPSKKEAPTVKPTNTALLAAAVKAGSKSKFKLKHVDPAPTANASDLRKVMEEGGEFAEKMKQCIIRAAVHASRLGKHGQSFLAPDGKSYPDVSKAFAAHAGLKPCTRCKNNKQGAYHCRLRRKHKELDHDGSNSLGELSPLLLLPMEDLLINPNGAK